MKCFYCEVTILISKLSESKKFVPHENNEKFCVDNHFDFYGLMTPNPLIYGTVTSGKILKVMFRAFFVRTISSPSRVKYYSRKAKIYELLPDRINTSISKSKLPPPTKINQATIELLESLSLVGFENEKGVQIVEDAIKLADQIFDVDTENVKPLLTVLENESVHLREDVVEKDATRNDILSNSKVVLEGYFISPPGNIEYIPEKKLREDSVNENIELEKKN